MIGYTVAELQQLLVNVDDSGLSESSGDVVVGDIMMTADGGIAKQYIYKGASPSVKGELMHPSLTTENAVSTEASEFDAVGAMYTVGAVDGEMVWIVFSGSAYLLLEDGTDTAFGNWVYASAIDGRADASLSQPAGGTIDALTDHFKEVGHSLDTQSSGTDVLALIHIHFN